MSFVKNCWYVDGWDIEVREEGFLARTIIYTPLPLPLPLRRDSNGEKITFATSDAVIEQSQLSRQSDERTVLVAPEQ